MNKITQIMHKEMIVKIVMGFVLFISLFSCRSKENDEMILELILIESEISFKDSLSFNKVVSNRAVIKFFKSRNSNDRFFRYTYNESNKLKAKDSSFYEVDSLEFFTQPINNNSYIRTGKGIDERVEEFLKDSFNYKEVEFKKWNISKGLKTNFIKDSINIKKVLTISKPVLNLNKRKAIVFKTIVSDVWVETTVYFLMKENDDWVVFYKETL